jgi:hypothetical protein
MQNLSTAFIFVTTNFIFSMMGSSAGDSHGEKLTMHHQC